MTYQKQIGLALAGIAVCAAPVLLPLIPKIGTYAQSERLKAEEELQRTSIIEQAKTSETLYEAGIAPTTKVLRMRRYVDTPKVDPKPDPTGFPATQLIVVYDSGGRCIGKIEDNQWYWKYNYSDVCNGKSSN
jgi:hypothetical protein